MNGLCLTLNVLSNTAYGRIRSYYKTQGYREVERWQEYLYNAVIRTIENSDAQHVNDLLMAAKEVDKYQSTVRIIRTIGLPWRLTVTRIGGNEIAKLESHNAKGMVKLNQDQRKRLAYLRFNGAIEIATAISKESEHQSQSRNNAAPANWNEYAANVAAIIERRIQFAEKAGASAEIVNKLKAAKAALAA